MRGFLAELKRRHVYRVAVVYAAAVWLLVRAWVQGVQGQQKDAQAALNEAVRLNPELDAGYVTGFPGSDIVEQMQAVGLTFPDD